MMIEMVDMFIQLPLEVMTLSLTKVMGLQSRQKKAPILLFYEDHGSRQVNGFDMTAVIILVILRNILDNRSL